MKLHFDITQFTVGLRLDESNNLHIQIFPCISLMFVRKEQQNFQDVVLVAHQQALEAQMRETIIKNKDEYKKEMAAKNKRDLSEYKRSLITTISLQLLSESSYSTDTVERATSMANEIIKASHED